MHKLQAIISVTTLRYCDLVRLDKLYYEAGSNSKKAKMLTPAFVFLNRYLDIYEVIDDPDNNNNLGDNSELSMTDIPSPYDVPLPEKNFLEGK